MEITLERRIPKVSVVIPNWFTTGQNGRYMDNETLILAWQCIKRMIDCTTDRGNVEYILIDNGSTVDMKLAGWGSEVSLWDMGDVVIKNPKNLGFAPAVNQGVNLARGEYICVVNNDIWVWDKWIEDILEAFEHEELDPKIGIVMPNLVKKQFQTDCLNVKGNKLDMNKVMKLEKSGLSLRNHGVYEKGAEFGSCFILKRELVEEIKGLNKEELGHSMFMDENFLLGMGEDRKVWNQTRLLGKETYRTNKTIVAHFGNLTITKVPDRKKYTEANREYLNKWREKNNIPTK